MFLFAVINLTFESLYLQQIRMEIAFLLVTIQMKQAKMTKTAKIKTLFLCLGRNSYKPNLKM